MTVLFALCIASPIALLLVGLVRTGQGGGAVKEIVDRRNAGTRAGAPVAPKVKFEAVEAALAAAGPRHAAEEAPLPAAA